MKFSSLVVPVALAIAAAAQSMQINTPTTGPVSCQPLLLSWTGGTGPFILDVVNGDNTSQTVVELGTSISGNSFSWAKVNVAAGKYGLKLIDSTGATAQSATFDIGSGSDNSCVGQSVSGSAGTASTTAAGSTGTTTGGASATTTGGSSATTSKAASSGSGSAASGAASASSSPNAAPTNFAHAGVAGLVGAAVLAIVV